MTGNRIQYTLDFKANLTDVEGQLSRLKSSLAAVMAMPWNNSGKTATADLNAAAMAAQKLQIHLNKAMNPKTGTFDIGRFASNMAVAGDSVEVLSHNLLKAGTTGQAAFLNIGNALVNAQTQLFKTNTLMSGLWTTLKNTARWQISSAVLTGFISAVSDALRYVEDIDTTLNQIRIVSGDSKKQMEGFAKAANKAAKELRVTTNEFAKANLIFRQQGDSMDKAMKKAELVTKLANVSDSTAEEMSEYATAIWNSYKVADRELESYLDKLVKVGAVTATSTEEMSTAMQKVAAAAHETGVEYEQLLSVISTVSSITRESAEMTGTAFKTIFARMTDLKIEGSIDDDGIKTTLGDVSGALEAIGVKVFDTNGQLRGTGDILEDLGNKWTSIDKNTQSAIAQAVAGKRQYTQLMALMGGWDMYKDTLNQISMSQGELNKQQEIYAQQLKAAKKELSAQKENLIGNIVDEKDLIKIVEGFADLVEGVSIFLEALGGISPVLNFILSIVLTKFAPKVASGFMAMSGSVVRFSSSFASAFKGTDTLVQQHINKWIGMIRQFQESGQFGNSQLSMEANNLSAILQIQQQIQARQQSMTESEKEIMNLRFEQLKQSQQILINKAKEAEMTARIAADTAKASAVKQTAEALATAAGGNKDVYAADLTKRLNESEATTKIKTQTGEMETLTVTIQKAAEMWDVFGAKQRKNLIEQFSGDIGMSENHIRNIITKLSDMVKEGMNVEQMLKMLKASYVDFAQTGNMSLVLGTPGSKTPEVYTPDKRTSTRAQEVLDADVGKTKVWGVKRDKELAQDVVDKSEIKELADNKELGLKAKKRASSVNSYTPGDGYNQAQGETITAADMLKSADLEALKSTMGEDAFTAMGQQLTDTKLTGEDLVKILEKIQKGLNAVGEAANSSNLDEEIKKAEDAAKTAEADLANAEAEFESKTGGGLATEKAKQKARRKELKKKKKEGTATIEEQSELEGMDSGAMEKNAMMMSQAAGAAMQLSSSLMMVTSYWSMITDPDTDGLTKLVGLLGAAGTVMTTLSTLMPILNTLKFIAAERNIALAESQAEANAAAYASPYIAIATLVIAALAGVVMLTMKLAKANSEAAEAEKKHKKATDDLQKSQEKIGKLEEEISSMEALAEALKSAQENSEKLAEATNNINAALGTNYDLLKVGSKDYEEANEKLRQRILLNERLLSQEKEKAMSSSAEATKYLTLASQDDDKFTGGQVFDNIQKKINSANKKEKEKLMTKGIRVATGTAMGDETFDWETWVEYAGKRLENFKVQYESLMDNGMTSMVLGKMLDANYAESDDTVKKVINALNDDKVIDLRTKSDDASVNELEKLYVSAISSIENDTLRQELKNTLMAEIDSMRTANKNIKLLGESSFSTVKEIDDLGIAAADAGKKMIEAMQSADGKVGYNTRKEYVESIMETLAGSFTGKNAEKDKKDFENKLIERVMSKNFNKENFGTLQAEILQDVIEQKYGKVTKDNVFQIELLLEEMGVVNAKELAQYELGVDSAKDAIQDLDLTSEDAADSIEQIRNETGLTKNELDVLIANEKIFNNNDLDVSQKILALKDYYRAINDTDNAIYKLLGGDSTMAFSNNIEDYAKNKDEMKKIFGEKRVEEWFLAGGEAGLAMVLSDLQRINEYEKASERSMTLSSKSAEERAQALKDLNEELEDLERERIEAYKEFYEELRNIEKDYKKERDQTIVDLKKSEKEWADEEVLERYKETCEQLLNVTKELDDTLKQYDFEEKLNKDVESAESLFNRMVEVGETNEKKAEQAKLALEKMLAIEPPEDAEALKEYNNTINELHKNWQDATLALKENNLESAMIAAIENQGARLQEEFAYLDKQKDLFNQLTDLNKKTGIFAQKGREVVLSQILISNETQSSKSKAAREKEKENQELIKLNKEFNKKITKNNTETRQAEIDQKQKERDEEWLKIHSDYDENMKELNEKRKDNLEQATIDLNDALAEIAKKIEDARIDYNNEIGLIQTTFNAAITAMTSLHDTEVQSWMDNLKTYEEEYNRIFGGSSPAVKNGEFTGGLVSSDNIVSHENDNTVKVAKGSPIGLPDYFNGSDMYVEKDGSGINIYKADDKGNKVEGTHHYRLSGSAVSDLNIKNGVMAAGQSLGTTSKDNRELTVNKRGVQGYTAGDESGDIPFYGNDSYSFRYDAAGYKGTKMPKKKDIVNFGSMTALGGKKQKAVERLTDAKGKKIDGYKQAYNQNMSAPVERGRVVAPEDGYLKITDGNRLYFRGKTYAFVISVKDFYNGNKEIAGDGNKNGEVKQGATLEWIDDGEYVYIKGADGVNADAKFAYADGTDSAPGGISLVGEEGKELVINPDGTCYIVGENGAEFVNLQAGAQVIPNEETEEILDRSEINPQNIDNIPSYEKGTSKRGAVPADVTATQNLEYQPKEEIIRDQQEVANKQKEIQKKLVEDVDELNQNLEDSYYKTNNNIENDTEKTLDNVATTVETDVTTLNDKVEDDTEKTLDNIVKDVRKDMKKVKRAIDTTESKLPKPDMKDYDTAVDDAMEKWKEFKEELGTIDDLEPVEWKSLEERLNDYLDYMEEETKEKFGSGGGNSATLDPIDMSEFKPAKYLISDGNGNQIGHKSSDFGWRNHPVKGDRRFHTGIDIGVGQQDDTYYAHSFIGGTVLRMLTTAESAGFGNRVEILGNDGRIYTYSHLSRFNKRISVGDSVSAGDIIGKVGTTGMSTGPHLHFEVIENGEHINPLNVIGNYATGTDGLPTDENAIVGELGPELAILPDGSVVMLGVNGVEYASLPAGTRILTSEQTQELLNSPNTYTIGSEGPVLSERASVKKTLHGKTYLDPSTGQKSEQWPTMYMMNAEGGYSDSYDLNELNILQQILDMDEKYVKQNILTTEEVEQIGRLVFRFVNDYAQEGLTKEQADILADSYNAWSVRVRNRAAETASEEELIQRISGVGTTFANNEGEIVNFKIPNLEETDENGTTTLKNFDFNDEYSRKAIRAFLGDYENNPEKYAAMITSKEAEKLKSIYYAYVLNNEEALLAMGEYTKESMEKIKEEYGNAYKNTKNYLIAQNVDANKVDDVINILKEVGTVEISKNETTGKEEAQYVLDKFKFDYSNDAKKKSINSEIRSLRNRYSNGEISDEEFTRISYDIERRNSRRDVELISADYDKYLDLYEQLKDAKAPQELLDAFVNEYLNPIGEKLMESMEDYENTLKDILNSQYDVMEKYFNELSSRYEHENNRLESLKSAYETRFSVLNQLADTQRDINKQLRDAKLSTQWLTLEGRKQLFNEKDHYRITKGIQEAREEINAAALKYTNEISKLSADEWYKEKGITEEYNRQVAAQGRKLAILQAEIGLEQKRNALTQALTEKNVRVFTGGRWQQMANYQNVQAAAQDYEDQLYEIEQAQREDAQANISDALQEKITSNNMEIDKLNKSLELMRKSIDDLFDATGNLTNLTKDELIEKIGSLKDTFDKQVQKTSKEINAGTNATTDSLRSHFSNYSEDEQKDVEKWIQEIYYQKVKYSVGTEEDKKIAAESAAYARKQLEKYMSKEAIDKYFGAGVTLQDFETNAKNIGYKDVADVDRISKQVTPERLGKLINDKEWATKNNAWDLGAVADNAIDTWEYIVSNYDIPGTENYKNLAKQGGFNTYTVEMFNKHLQAEKLHQEAILKQRITSANKVNTHADKAKSVLVGKENVAEGLEINKKKDIEKKENAKRQKQIDNFYSEDDILPAIFANFFLGYNENQDGARQVFLDLEAARRNMENAKAKENSLSNSEGKKKAKEEYEEARKEFEDLLRQLATMFIGKEDDNVLEFFDDLTSDQIASMIRMIYDAKNEDMALLDKNGKTTGLDTALWNGQFEISESTKILLELMIKENKNAVDYLLQSIKPANNDIIEESMSQRLKSGYTPISVGTVEMFVDNAAGDGRVILTQLVDTLNQLTNSVTPGQ